MSLRNQTFGQYWTEVVIYEIFSWNLVWFWALTFLYVESIDKFDWVA